MKLTITIFLSLLAIGSLTFSNAQKNKGADKETIIEKIKAAVESGEITREQAAQKIACHKKLVGNTHEDLGRKHKTAVKAGKMTEEEAKAKFEEMTKKISGEKPNPDIEGVMKRIKMAVKSGKITEEEAKKRMAEFKKRLSSESGKKEKRIMLIL